MDDRPTIGPIEAAALSGDRRTLLEAALLKVAQTMDKTESGRDVAQLTNRLLDTAAELDTLPAGDASPLQQARARHAAE
jgi:hypothetical protein